MKKYLIILCVLSFTISKAQKKYNIVGLTNESEVYLKIDKLIDVIDFDADIVNETYSMAVRDTLSYFNKNEKLKIKVKQLNFINSKISEYQNSQLDNKEKRILNKEIKNLIKEYLNKKFEGINLNSYIDYTYEENNNKKLIKELETDMSSNNLSIKNIKKEAINNLSSEEIDNFTKIKKSTSTLVKIDDLSKIKGIYIPKEMVYISNTFDLIKKKQKGEFLTEKEVYVLNNNKYTQFYWYENTDGTGVDFYSKDGQLYNKHLQDINVISNQKPSSVIINKNNIIAKMKVFKVQMNALVDDMAKFRSNPSVAKEATKKGQLLQKKVNALYDNDDSNYYDFVQLLDIDTIEVMSEFNQVLRGAVILFRL